MTNPSSLGLWASALVLRRAFREQQAVLADVHRRAALLVRTPPGTPPAYEVGLDPLPENHLALRKNLFSTLFQSVYHLLDIASERRMLYGRINQLFRIWVTSADNLLDDEDKIPLPIRMPGESRIMRQVVAIMAADRILAELLSEAVAGGVLVPGDAEALSAGSLRALLPSAAQEASEEGGITVRPPPEEVLGTIHRLKTGLLFHLPFLGPEQVERNVDRRRMEALKEALMAFALGCQILDDIRDLARDHRERRHNYVLSCLAWAGDPFLKELDERKPEPGVRIYLEIPGVVAPAARLAMDHLRAGLAGMSRAGLGLREGVQATLAESMFGVLDLEDLCHAR